MKTYAMPGSLGGLIFDIDRTLYDNESYAESQVESQFVKAAEFWGVEVQEARNRVAKWRSKYAAANDGAHQSLGNTLEALGIPIRTSVAWRQETIRPEDYLVPDRRLEAALRVLAGMVPMIAVTNNPVSVGLATLETLGVADHFTGVVGLDSTWKSKPSVEPFVEGLARLRTPAATTVSVGDRYDVDIAPALSLGMGAILVEGVSEVYELPDMFAHRGLIRE